MSSDSGSDSGSSSSYSSYDEAGISTPTSAYESIGNTGYSDFASPSSTTASQDFSTQAVSGGQTDYNGGGGNDYSGPTYDEAALSQPSTITGPTDPGVAGTYVDGKFVPSQDTIKGIPGYIQNIQAEYASILYHFYYHLWEQQLR
jgi:hypothetical protein